MCSTPRSGASPTIAPDGDYVGVVEALAAAGAPTHQTPPSADPAIDAVLVRHGIW